MMSGLNEYTCIERVTVSDIFARLCIERNLDNTTFKQKLYGKYYIESAQKVKAYPMVALMRMTWVIFGI